MQTNSSPSQRLISSNPNSTASRLTQSPSLKLGKGGFSLVEVVLALGVISFAFVALFGLLPVGLNTFNNSIDSTMEVQIAENVMSQLRQDKFSTLVTDFNDSNGGLYSNGLPSFFKQPSTTAYLPPATGFYYDDQGNFLALVQAVPQSSYYTSTPPANYIYTAGVQVYYDTIPLSGASPSDPVNNSAVVSTVFNSTTPQPLATVVITIRKFSSPNVARIYTGFIENNGL